MKKFFSLIAVSFLALASSKAQVQTISVNFASVLTNGLYSGGILTVSSNSFACLKSLIGPNPWLQINFQGATITYPQGILANNPLVIAGPATIQIWQSQNPGPAGAFATFSVEPAPFPPNKAVTVGAYAGNVQVTMQVSTDLVNWTPAVNGQVYTNSPDARFFRIQLVTNASP